MILNKWISICTTYEQIHRAMLSSPTGTPERMGALAKMIPLASNPVQFQFLEFQIAHEGDIGLAQKLAVAAFQHFYLSDQQEQIVIPPELSMAPLA